MGWIGVVSHFDLLAKKMRLFRRGNGWYAGWHHHHKKDAWLLHNHPMILKFLFTVACVKSILILLQSQNAPRVSITILKLVPRDNIYMIVMMLKLVKRGALGGNCLMNKKPHCLQQFFVGWMKIAMGKQKMEGKLCMRFITAAPILGFDGNWWWCWEEQVHIPYQMLGRTGTYPLSAIAYICMQ